MCGIAGIVRSDGGPIDIALVRKMTVVQAHRGPDGEGFFEDSGAGELWSEFDRARSAIGRRSGCGGHASASSVALGHRRLAILDLSEAGRQPMPDSAQRYWIVYNGEVYNYIELRRMLRTRGHVFRSDSDTEVVLASYIEWGPECLRRFNGMWAFAIWDSRERTLFCARDRFGVKPLYFHWKSGNFVFASEIKAVLLAPGVSRALDEQPVVDFLLSGSADHIPGHTFFAEIAQLLPAHYLIIKNGELRTCRYWDIDGAGPKRDVTGDLIAECRELLTDAARLRLRSDVPVGGTLSGGIDSATITALVDQRLATGVYHVFSVQFPGHQQDESRYVSELAAQSSHVRLHMLTPRSAELVQDLPRLIWHQEEPFGDTSVYAHYRLMQLARENGVKVLLTGQGADEVFCGYGSYYRAYLGHLLACARISTLIQEIRKRQQIAGENVPDLVRAAFYHAAPPWLRTRVQSAVLHHNSSWLRPEVANLVMRRRFWRRPKGWSRLDWYLYEALRKWSLPHILRHDDRNSMAFGIESRAPYLDFRLAELLFSTADEAKVANGRMKTLLRGIGTGLIPESITNRTDKIGFFTPLGDWLADAREFTFDLLNTEFAKTNPYFSAQTLSQMAAGSPDSSLAGPLWWGLSLSLWYEVMVRGARLSIEPEPDSVSVRGS
jgi:asparagine synthase (glutamine-hydrolysing)